MSAKLSTFTGAILGIVSRDTCDVYSPYLLVTELPQWSSTDGNVDCKRSAWQSIYTFRSTMDSQCLMDGGSERSGTDRHYPDDSVKMYGFLSLKKSTRSARGGNGLRISRINAKRP